MQPASTDGTEFLTEHVDWIFALATVLTPRRADAEDVAQEVLIRALRHSERVRNAASPKAYLRRMTVNEVIRFGRRSPRAKEVALVDQVVEEPGYENADLQVETRRLLAGLSRRRAVAVALYYLEGCSYSEVAAALHCREGTARSLVSRGLAQLRDGATGNASRPVKLPANVEEQ
jgi:RNA polymerase sigma factor (sigma-70 family)